MISNEWRIRTNNELELLFQKPNILEIIWSKRLKSAGHAWRSQNPLLCIILEKDPTGKRPLGRPRMRWEYLIIMMLSKGNNTVLILCLFIGKQEDL